MSQLILKRRTLLRSMALTALGTQLAACNTLDDLAAGDSPVRRVLASANSLTYRIHRLLQSPGALAPEYSEKDIRQSQRPNGSTDPGSDEYAALKAADFKDYRLEVLGLVETPSRFSIDELKALGQRTQITRHDCVEGWSTIAKWHGTPLAAVLAKVGVKSGARYVLFRCFDAPSEGLSGPELYYETIDLFDANHPQTILAYDMNDKPLPVENGAPLRLRVERQLGYKMAKYVRSIELVSDFGAVSGGGGGYWEDRGYDWYAGI